MAVGLWGAPKPRHLQNPKEKISDSGAMNFSAFAEISWRVLCRFRCIHPSNSSTRFGCKFMCANMSRDCGWWPTPRGRSETRRTSLAWHDASPCVFTYTPIPTRAPRSQLTHTRHSFIIRSARKHARHTYVFIRMRDLCLHVYYLPWQRCLGRAPSFAIVPFCAMSWTMFAVRKYWHRSLSFTGFLSFAHMHAFAGTVLHSAVLLAAQISIDIVSPDSRWLYALHDTRAPHTYCSIYHTIYLHPYRPSGETLGWKKKNHRSFHFCLFFLLFFFSHFFNRFRWVASSFFQFDPMVSGPMAIVC